MSKLSAKIAVAGISAALVFASVTTSFAMPMPVPAAPAAADVQTDVQPVQWRGGHYYGGGYRGGYYGGGYRGGYGGGYYRGYRGYPTYRSGYRYYNGYWFPLAAFGAGALIGGAIASQPRYYAPAPAPAGINPRHYEWCANRYRSYRAYDNTFQPNYGPRQQCLSPYY